VYIFSNYIHCWWECKLLLPLWKTVWSFLKKLKIELPYDPVIPLLGHFERWCQRSQKFPGTKTNNSWDYTFQKTSGRCLLSLLLFSYLSSVCCIFKRTHPSSFSQASSPISSVFLLSNKLILSMNIVNSVLVALPSSCRQWQSSE